MCTRSCTGVLPECWEPPTQGNSSVGQGGRVAAPFLTHSARRPGGVAKAPERAHGHGSGRHALCPIVEAPAAFDAADFGPSLRGAARSARSRSAGRGRRRGGVGGSAWPPQKTPRHRLSSGPGVSCGRAQTSSAGAAHCRAARRRGQEVLAGPGLQPDEAHGSQAGARFGHRNLGPPPHCLAGTWCG